MAIGDNIIDALGISWVLDTSSDYATLTYNHRVLGLLQYTGTATWIADNVNTVHLTSRGSLPGPEDEGYVKVLPDEVCIRPLYDSNGCGCYDTTEKYDTVENQCACKDPACDCIPEKICLDCDGSTECCEGNACIGRDGVDNPSGPGYELCCVLLGVNVCGVWYCSAGQWKVDIYCNDVLITTNGISHEGCPLKLGTTGFDGCEDCVVCVGEDCEPPPPPREVCCCPGAAIPDILVADDGTNTLTLTRGATTDAWTGTGAFNGCASSVVTLTCDSGCGWVISIDTAGSCVDPSVVSVACSPFTYSATNYGSNCDSVCRTITVTA